MPSAHYDWHIIAGAPVSMTYDGDSRTIQNPMYSPCDLAAALELPAPTEEQAAIIAAPPGPLVVIAGAGSGKTETMAARVVWLVANGFACPEQVLGLTFTRKAAGQLLRRVRARLARLADCGGVWKEGTGSATVNTYHAFAGELLREFGVLVPVEPDARLLGVTEMWQLAYEVVSSYSGPLDSDKTPAAITSMVLRLCGELAEHLIDTHQLCDTHSELERLVHTLPAGRHQREGGPGQWLLSIVENQRQRSALVPLIDALHQRMRAEHVMDFGMQMSTAARLVSAFPVVADQLRARYRVVLLDEYQDTGYAQRIVLSSLFGGGVDGSLALTAVGDPIQSIYGWRGASATNLPRFATDFPRADGSAAHTVELRTSWRNCPNILDIANALSEPARHRSVAVRPLRSRPGAHPGTVLCALHQDIYEERRWVADHMARCYTEARDSGNPIPTMAILVRRNADAGPLAHDLAERGIPVDVVGLGGLLSIPEIVDVVAMLRFIADPCAGDAAMQVLTGPRWRLGAHDLATLWRRASELNDVESHDNTVEQIVAAAASQTDNAYLADAVADPGPAASYSAEGYRRICALAAEVTTLRAFMNYSLTDLLAETRRILGIDCEVRAARPVADGWTGTEHLDRFADVVAGYSERCGADVVGLLAYLDAAAVVENGLAPGEVSVVNDRVQIMTVHAAKGLEWQVVAVPHLSSGVFPSTASQRSWLTDPADLPPLLRGDRASDGVQGVPVLDTSAAYDRKQLADIIIAHRDQLQRRRSDEERRLLYVAITRAEHTLLVSGYHWGATGATPRGPSEFLGAIKDIIDTSTGAGQPCGVIEAWADSPGKAECHRLCDGVDDVVWPADPLGSRRADVDRGAELVQRAMAEPAQPPVVDSTADPEGWVADVDALLAERAASVTPSAVVAPAYVSVSTLVDLSRDSRVALDRLRRRLPRRPDPHAQVGTAFHDWVQRYYRADRLFDIDDIPGAVDGPERDNDELTALYTAFSTSPWAMRTPLDVEVPFEMMIGTTMVRGRIDAVFADPDGTMRVIDWKTGEPAVDEHQRWQAAIQLAVYRLAWAGMCGCPESAVQAAFYYVRSGRTVIPEKIPGATELESLVGLLSHGDTH